MKKIALVAISALLVIAMLAGCTQYIFVPLPGGDETGKPSGNTTASDTLTFMKALEKQLPGHVNSIINDKETVSGLERVTDSGKGLSILASRAGNDTATVEFRFTEAGYSVEGYGTITSGSFSVKFTGIKADTILTSETCSMDFTALEVTKEGKTSSDTITITGLSAPSSAKLTVSADNTISKVENFDSFSLTQAISTDTTITMNGSSVSKDEIAGSNTSGDFASGFGTEVYPYIINTADQLFKFADLINSEELDSQGRYFKLGSDINLQGRSWTPVGFQKTNASPYSVTEEPDFLAFKGSFDGANHTISNLSINLGTSSSQYLTKEMCFAGLFGVMGKGSALKNLTIHNANITADSFIGTFVGYVPNSPDSEKTDIVLENLHVTGTLQINASTNAGGIIGRNEQAKTKIAINNCSVDTSSGSYIHEVGTNNVSTNFFGGIIGVAYSSETNTMTNCSVSNLDISGRIEAVGGLVGGFGPGSIEGCSVNSVSLSLTDAAAWDGIAIGAFAGVVTFTPSASGTQLTLSDNSISDIELTKGPNDSERELFANGYIGTYRADAYQEQDPSDKISAIPESPVV